SEDQLAERVDYVPSSAPSRSTSSSLSLGPRPRYRLTAASASFSQSASCTSLRSGGRFGLVSQGRRQRHPDVAERLVLLRQDGGTPCQFQDRQEVADQARAR